MCKYRSNDNELVFLPAGEVISPGGIVELHRRANTVEDHSAELLFSIDDLLKDRNFVRFEFNG